MTTLKACLLFSLLLIFFSVQAQRYDLLLKILNNEYRQEKLHLHFDRPVYNPGETIWFKAYLFAAGFPSEVSNTLYAEMLDGNGNVIERKSMPVLASGAAGSFDIPAGINTANVLIRAYTRWMLNFDSTFIYSKAIRLTNFNIKKKTAPAPGSTATQEVKPLFYLQLFPEGGDLVQGIESAVAFKATDGTGMPADIKGDIVDGKGKKIISFTPAHDGMGVFLLEPQPGEQYKAVWQDPAGQQHETPLKAARPTGVTLELINRMQEVDFSVKRPGATAPWPYVQMIAQMNGIMLYSAKLNIGMSAVINNVIPVKDFGAGIMQVTLFTPDGQPVAERLVFINQEDRFTPDIKSTVRNMDKRKKNVIEIEVPDTLLSNLSVAVTDADLTATHTEENIFSRLLLTSDIRGYVHDPAYYFSGGADSVVNHLDLVMMTNGWRRFRWEDMLAGKWPALRYSPENYISISGDVSGLNEKHLSNKELNVFIKLKNGNNQFLNTTLLPGGKFILPDLIFYDTAKFFYQFNNDKRKALTSRAKFSIKNNLLTKALAYKPELSLPGRTWKQDSAIVKKNEEIYTQLTKEEQLRIKTLKPVVIKVRKKSIEQIRDEEYTSGFFSGSSATSRIYLPENDIAFTSSQNVYNYLQSRGGGGLQLDQMSATWRGRTTIYFVNEIERQPYELRLIPMTDVAMIKIISSPFFGAFGGSGGGAVAVYLKKGLSDSYSMGLESFIVRGYSPVKEFYSPDYSITASAPEPDYRVTLFWEPFVITDKYNRKVTLTFYNNDITKKMKVIIEGCNENGQLTRVEKVL
jgi:hypothetical protein